MRKEWRLTMAKTDTCPSCGRELEPGLNECHGCGSATPSVVLLDPKSLMRQVGRILLIIAIGLILKLFLIE